MKKYKQVLELKVSDPDEWLYYRKFGNHQKIFSVEMKVGSTGQEIKNAIGSLIYKHMRSRYYDPKTNFKYSVRITGKRITPKTEEERQFPGPSRVPNYFQPINKEEYL